MTGKDRIALELNQYLESVRTKIYQIYRELLQDDKPVTAFSIIRKYYKKPHVYQKYHKGRHQKQRLTHDALALV